MLSTLPPELLVKTLSYLDIYGLHTVYLVNRDFAAFIKENESVIYHNAAIYHGFIGPRDLQPKDARKTYPGRWLDNLSGWKDLCRRFLQLEYNWEARGEIPSVHMYSRTGPYTHRFKLDEREGRRFIISTYRGGGLRVTCMITNTVLFDLDDEYVRFYAHCEYDNDYLIFDRLHPHSLEIWRLESDDWDGIAINSTYKPDQMMLDIASQARDSDLPYPRRGHFAPWALFTPSQPPRAYRFVHPTLLVGSERGQELYLFDAPSASLINTIPLPPSLQINILYVEIGARHAFVCTPHHVLIFSRDWNHDGNADNLHSIFLRFPSPDPELPSPRLSRHNAARLKRLESGSIYKSRYIVCAPEPESPQANSAVSRQPEMLHEFTAVHVSPSGEDFVAINSSGLIYFVRNFERVFRGEASFSDVTLCLELDSPALNLAYEFDRVVVQTLGWGIYVFSLHNDEMPPYNLVKGWNNQINESDDERENSLGFIHPYPSITASSFISLQTYNRTRLSCLKLTKTGVWMEQIIQPIWRAAFNRNEGLEFQSCVVHVSFAPSISHVRVAEEQQ